MNDSFDYIEREISSGQQSTHRKCGLWNSYNPFASTLDVERPSLFETGVLIKTYSDIDTYLLENDINCCSDVKVRFDPKTVAPVEITVPLEELKELLRSAAINISTNYAKYSNSISTTYNVPGTYSFAQFLHLEKNQNVNAAMVAIDGKCYDANFIYRRIQEKNEFERVCKFSVPLPSGCGNNNTMEPLPIKNVSTDVFRDKVG
jgi:hypothetical protein